MPPCCEPPHAHCLPGFRNRCIVAGTNCIRRDRLARCDLIRTSVRVSEFFYDLAGQFSRDACFRHFAYTLELRKRFLMFTRKVERNLLHLHFQR